MSLLAHLREYYDDYKVCLNQINKLFRSRPPVTFTVYPEDYEVTGVPTIYCSPASKICTRVPDSEERMRLVQYYRDRLGYEIKNPDEYVVLFEHDRSIAYPLEVLYITDLESYIASVIENNPDLPNPPNPFTIVI